ncbi:BspA family leucine-rich repeat surface protein [Mycoplasma capricolum]|uniref:BspA family leucine-rich repeat surface protein n=1 Tax=Mycoplasma capricolum TaxID=2095 RepID=UPI0022F3EA4D|nr:BspA family leucine-rich repeat surface protein [Mycoplasma capricolum]WBX35887.1 BspA family leucine-rich repeat surface protein [Mycoplasma capricolum subsp. capricolum]
MKKILTILTSFSLIVTSSVLVVACKTNQPEKKLEELKNKPDNNSKKEEKKEESLSTNDKMPQGDKLKKEEKDIESNSSSHLTKDNINILSSIEDESIFIKKYYEWWSKTKKDNIPHFINPKDSNEILILGYAKEGKNGYKLNPLPENINKVPSKLPKLITSLESAFKNNKNERIEGIETWDTSNIKNMYQTFFGTSNFNGDITKWNTENVDDMRYMFSFAGSFDRDLSNWKINPRNLSIGFANGSTFDKKKNLWPPFKNK